MSGKRYYAVRSGTPVVPGEPPKISKRKRDDDETPEFINGDSVALYSELIMLKKQVSDALAPGNAATEGRIPATLIHLEHAIESLTERADALTTLVQQQDTLLRAVLSCLLSEQTKKK
jgi:hypothetical protein